jgi:ABC-2 type transport system permease protein
MNKTWLIIKREYWTRVRKRSFILMRLLGPLIMAGVGIMAFYLSIEEHEDQKILVVDENHPVFTSLKSTSLIEFDVQNIELDQGLDLLNSSDYTALLHIYKDYYKIHAGALYFKKQPSFRVQSQIERAVQLQGELLKLSEFDISESDYRRIKTPFIMQAFKYDAASESSEETSNLPAVVGIVFSILVYMFIFMYSVQVMRGVIEEKTNRIVEVIISSVTPIQLMLGKIIGIAGVGLTQFLIWITLSLSLFGIGQSIVFAQYDASSLASNTNMTAEIAQEMDKELAEKTIRMSNDNNILNQIARVNFPLMIGLFIFYFIGGYLLYSAMMAAVGSAVDNDTDTQQFILPITFPLLLSYIASFVIFNNPNSSIAVWLSIIPFTSPVTMLVRVAFGIESSDLWQVWLSMGLLIATFITMVWISSKIYRTGILMYGKKASFREFIKWINY